MHGRMTDGRRAALLYDEARSALTEQRTARTQTDGDGARLKMKSDTFRSIY